VSRVYFDVGGVDDELLKDSLTPEAIDKSSRYIEDLAYGLGVEVRDIVDPVPFKVSELAEDYALMETAKKKSMMNSNGATEGADAYELKRRVYAREVSELEGQITADMLEGTDSVKRRTFPGSVPIYRC
jgi:hypothetical protein